MIMDGYLKVSDAELDVLALLLRFHIASMISMYGSDRSKWPEPSYTLYCNYESLLNRINDVLKIILNEKDSKNV